jgi:hypothetical protein
MHQEIWMASYLQKSRFSSFKRALKSFNDQTLKAPVALSVCGPEAWRVVQWARDLLTAVPYELFLYDERWSQFDQLYMIHRGRVDKDIFISVCDDDDFFSESRIEIQQKFLKSPIITLKCGTKGSCPDFGSFCFHYDRMTEFFEFFQTKDAREFDEIPPDMLFMATFKVKVLPYILYHRTSSLLDRKWIEEKEGGQKWFHMTLIDKGS